MTVLSPMSVKTVVQGEIVRVKWSRQSPRAHEFVAIACPEDDGGYSVFALNYPGVISQGDTLDEARTNIAEAFSAMLEARRKRREEMAFSQATIDVPPNASRLRVTVNG
jgi:predicted RNase H-like HicB family nuclease